MNQEATQTQEPAQQQQTQPSQSEPKAEPKGLLNDGEGQVNFKEPNQSASWPPKGFEDDQDLVRYKDLDSVAKTLKEQKKLISSSVRIPGEDATDDDWGKFYSKLRPENPEDYQIELKIKGENGEEQPFEMPEHQANMYKELAHKHGITQKQFNSFLNDLLMKEQEMQASNASNDKQVLKDEWGSQYGKNAAIVDQMYKRLDDDVKQSLAAIPLKDQSKILLQFGKLFVEDVSPKDVKVASQDSVQDLNKKIASEMKAAFKQGSKQAIDEYIKEKVMPLRAQKLDLERGK